MLSLHLKYTQTQDTTCVSVISWQRARLRETRAERALKVPCERGLFSDDSRLRSVAPFGPSDDELRTQTAPQYTRQHREKRKCKPFGEKPNTKNTHTPKTACRADAHSQHHGTKSDPEAGERSTGSVAHVSRAPTCRSFTCAPLSHSVVLSINSHQVPLLVEERERSLCTAQKRFFSCRPRAQRRRRTDRQSNRKDTCSSAVVRASAPTRSCTQPDAKKISPCTLHHPLRKHNEGVDEKTDTLWKGAGGVSLQR